MRPLPNFFGLLLLQRMYSVVYLLQTLLEDALVNFYRNLMQLPMLYVKPVQDVDIPVIV